MGRRAGSRSPYVTAILAIPWPDDSGLCDLRQIGRFLSELDSRDLVDSTVFVVISDHGEEFLEHGSVEHGVDLYQEVLHVPLVISGPGVPGGVVIDTPVSQMDIFPTICSLAGIPPPPGLPGTDILTSPPEGRDIPSSGVLWSSSELASVRRDGMKSIWNVDSDSLETFDLNLDPGELEVLPPDSSLLDAVLHYWATPALVRAPLVPFGETMNRELRDLGYIR